MPEWLTKAKQAFRRERPRDPEPFEITCGCGWVARGIRASKPRTASCPDCGDVLFILPDDVYPPIKNPRKPKTRRVPSSEPEQDQTETQRPDRRDPRARRNERTEAEPRERTSQVAATPAEKEPVPPPNQVRAAPIRRRGGLTRFRLLVVAIVAIVAVTAWFAIGRQRADRAEETLQSALSDGSTALEREDFTAAAAAYERAVQALDRLKRTDAAAESIRLYAREAAALDKLVNSSLFEIMQDTEKARQQNQSDWESRFRTLYGGKWVVLDTLLDPSGDKLSPWSLVFPIIVDDKPVSLAGNLKVFDRFTRGGEPRRIVIAVQLDDCKFDASGNQRWVVSLNPKSAFLWCHADSYKHLGFDADDPAPGDSVDKVLSLQSELMGVKP